MKIEDVFIRTEFNYDRDLASDLTALANEEPSMTKQSFVEESDINTIVKRFGLTGQLPSDIRMPLNGDFQEVPDFRTAMQLLVEAREGFMQMPADVRARFGNDPAAFVDFISNDENRAEAERLGIVPKKAVQAQPGQPVAGAVTPSSTPTT